MNVRMKTRALLALSVLAVIGCHHLGAPPPEGEGEAEAGPAEEDTDTCTGGQFIGHVLVETPEELAELAGITGIGWDLKIQCPDCDDLSVLG